ncbi:MAG: APC family permease [Bacteroidetes bacterium]|nr:MAG: APC family permease [Bacteroidota bacterium]TAG88610.1 MAG: APC family permease [Bacteroidota bacterium]
MELNNTGRVTLRTAVTIVVANMVGAGVFTVLGYQALGTAAVFPLLLLWVIGGVVAMCGALSYGEMAALFPRSGGEYNYLSNTYHPAFGFLSGWISATVGFSAPVAMAGVALGTYSSSIIGLPPQAIAIAVIILISIIHSTDVGLGSIFQQYSTALKVILIIGFIFGGLLLTPNPQPVMTALIPTEKDWSMVFSAGFAINLAFVSFAYSGWNAAAYLANEIENPRVNVPRALVTGTLIVMIAYILLNIVFLYTLPVNTYLTEQLANIKANKGPLEVGYLSAQQFLGDNGGKIMAGMIALLLISSISAMIFAGPRVMQTMGEDVKILNFLSYKNKKDIPVLAIILQSTISIILVLTAQFDTILSAIAFTLDIFTFATVLGVFVMRYKAPQAERAYKTWGYPITPLIFLGVTGWTMYYLLTERTIPSLIALGVVLLGLVVYFINQQTENKEAK